MSEKNWKAFITDSGDVYRCFELQITPELLADDRALATLLRGHLRLSIFDAVVVRVIDQRATPAAPAPDRR